MMGRRAGERSVLPKRHDPPSLTLEGAIGDRAILTNMDPAREYCLANPNDSRTGVPEMLKFGWVIENHRKDGPKIDGLTSKDGDLLTVEDQVVMSRPRELHKAALKRAWDIADVRAKAIGQPGGIDGVRGDGGRPAQFADDPREYAVISRS